MAQSFEMNLDLGNEAFDEPGKRQSEIERILGEVRDRVSMGEASGSIFDINGNRVGDWGFDEVDDAVSVCAEHGVELDEQGDCPECVIERDDRESLGATAGDEDEPVAGCPHGETSPRECHDCLEERRETERDDRSGGGADV